MAIEERKIHKALLDGNKVLDKEITNGFHCEVNQISALFGDPDRLQAKHERGNFCLSFKLWANNQSADAKPKKCVRVWHANTIIEKQRFQLISDGLAAYRLPYFTSFVYKEHGVDIEGNIIPAIFMDWIDGKTLTTWIPQNRNTPDNIKALADKFLKMCCKLNSLGIAHGDLCCENILVSPSGEIKLVDYDSIFVPSMGGQFKAVTAGWSDFQHPKRVTCIFATAKDDFFSQHVIYLSLLAYSRFTQLIPEKPEKSMIFNKMDYINDSAFTESKAYKFIIQNCKQENTTDRIILNELRLLRKAISSDVTNVTPLKDTLSDNTISGAYVVRYMKFCTQCGTRFKNDTDRFCTQCGSKRRTI